MKNTILAIVMAFVCLGLAACGTQSDDSSTTDTVDTPAVMDGDDASSVTSSPYSGYSNMYPGYYGFARGHRYGTYAISYYHHYDSEYLQALRIKAEAALIKAKAEARQMNAVTEAIRLAISEIESGLYDIRLRLKAAQQQQQAIVVQAKVLDLVANKGDASTDAVKAIRFFMKMADLSNSELARMEVAAFDAGQFRTNGSNYTIERNENGDYVFVRGGEARAFTGSNMLQFVEFLSETQQDIKVGSDAHIAILGLLDMIEDAGTAWLERINDDIEEIRAERRKDLKTLIQLVEEYQ